jgi:hypothetical protein
MRVPGAPSPTATAPAISVVDSLATYTELHNRIVGCLEVDGCEDLMGYNTDGGVQVDAPAVVDAYFN